MKQELDEKLVKAFPILYRDRNKDMRQTCMVWGFSHDDGWFDIIWELSEKLETIAKLQPAPKEGEEDTRLVAVQVKEKFGGLRFYTHNSTEEAEAAIDEAEQKAGKTCETCGQIGSLRSRQGWLITLCNKDWKAYKKERGDKEDEENKETK